VTSAAAKRNGTRLNAAVPIRLGSRPKTRQRRACSRNPQPTQEGLIRPASELVARIATEARNVCKAKLFRRPLELRESYTVNLHQPTPSFGEFSSPPTMEDGKSTRGFAELPISPTRISLDRYWKELKVTIPAASHREQRRTGTCFFTRRPPKNGRFLQAY